MDKLKAKAIKWPYKRVEIQQARVSGLTGIGCDFTADMKRIEARAIDMEDRAIYDEVVRTAREAGIDSLFLMDRQFVVDALREKLERDFYGKQ